MAIHRSGSDTRGTLEIGPDAIPWVDLRPLGAAALEVNLKNLLHDLPSAQPGLRLIVLALPQRSDQLALTLAREGIHLLVGPATVAAAGLLERFREQLRILASAGSTATTLPSAGVSGGSPSQRRSRSESPYAQQPPWFNPAAFDERIRQLQQPWHDTDTQQSD